MSSRKLLKEALGVFDGCEEIAVNIAKRLMYSWSPEQQNQPFEVPFEYCQTKKLIISPTNLRIRAAYLLDKNFTKGNDVIIVNPNILMDKFYDLVKTMMHELTHVYEDYQRRLKNSSIMDYGLKTGYRGASKRLFGKHRFYDDDEMKDEISEIMVYLSTFEVNATLASLYSRIKYPYTDRDLKTVDDVLMYIYDTPEYQRIMGYANTARLYAETKDEEDMNLILDTLNELYANEPNERRFKTKEQARNYFRVLCDRTEKKVNQVIPKLVYAYFHQEN